MLRSFRFRGGDWGNLDGFVGLGVLEFFSQGQTETIEVVSSGDVLSDPGLGALPLLDGVALFLQAVVGVAEVIKNDGIGVEAVADRVYQEFLGFGELGALV